MGIEVPLRIQPGIQLALHIEHEAKPEAEEGIANPIPARTGLAAPLRNRSIGLHDVEALEGAEVFAQGAGA
jgi:hypothetical protein